MSSRSASLSVRGERRRAAGAIPPRCVNKNRTEPWPLPKARPISCNDSPAFQRRHMSARYSAESLFRLPCAMNTTFRKMIHSRWCCIDQLSRHRSKRRLVQGQCVHRPVNRPISAHFDLSRNCALQCGFRHIFTRTTIGSAFEIAASCSRRRYALWIPAIQGRLGARSDYARGSGSQHHQPAPHSRLELL
jgi:hypothetical protein